MSSAPPVPSLFDPIKLGPLSLRNRVVKAATFEGGSPGGDVSDALVEHHRGIARGGAAMTTVAYVAVSPEGRTYDTQRLATPALASGLRRLADAVHGEGGAISIQLVHSGDFANKKVIGTAPLGPIRRFDTYGLAFARAMTRDDIARVTADFARAALLARDNGCDAVEIHCGHGYLLSQFLSPYTNRRTDEYGGSLEHRARLPVEVLRAVRAACGDAYPVLIKTNLRDGFPGGLEIDEACEIGRRLEAEGATALVPSGGFVSRTPFFMLRGELPVMEMAENQTDLLPKMGLYLFGKLLVQEYPFEEAFFLEDARRLRAVVRLPLALLGGMKSRARIDEGLRAGFDLIGMGRALIHDPDFVHKLRRGEIDASLCRPCNRCVSEMDRGGVRCVLDLAGQPAPGPRSEGR